MDTVIPLRAPVPLRTPAVETPVIVETVVRLDGLRLMAAVGINRCEIGRRQPLVIFAELGLEHDGAATGGPGVEHLDQTVDYRAIAAAAEGLAGGHIDLIETFARRLGDMCMALPVAGGRVAWASVRIDKPEAVDNGLASVSVRLRVA